MRSVSLTVRERSPSIARRLATAAFIKETKRMELSVNGKPDATFFTAFVLMAMLAFAVWI